MGGDAHGALAPAADLVSQPVQSPRMNDADATTPEPQARSTPEAKLRPAWQRWLARSFRPLLLILGIGTVVLLVRQEGPERVWQTLVGAAAWMPAIFALEIAFMGMDTIALRGLFGERGRVVPPAVWIRTALLQYGVMQLLPAGRAGGEVARAAGLAPYVGSARAAAMATRLQATTLLANSVISVPCWLAVAYSVGAASALGFAVLGNGVVTLALGGALLLVAGRSKLGAWIGRKFPKLGQEGASFDEALRHGGAWVPALAATSFGRIFQTVQYGLIVAAVGGYLSIDSALISQAIHLVGAGLGDMVPNQAGITETAYRWFAPAAPALGLEGDGAKAIVIALIARICQFSLAGASLLVTALWKGQAAPETAD